jgi:uncharacterized peroxidase-related enzyme
MSRLQLRTIGDAHDEAQPFLAAAEKSNWYLPNLLRLLANAPAALEAYLTVSGLNARASPGLAEREAVQITAASVHGCGFCIADHSKIAAQRAKLAAPVIEALRNCTIVDDARLDAIARFIEVVIASRGAVTDAELAKFIAAGFTEQAALEVVLRVSLATLCNFANNLGQPPLNE